ncbi:unnamed protein product [Effrenium voratum]|nr:unnamed protein product [Effrenium voratum]
MPRHERIPSPTPSSSSRSVASSGQDKTLHQEGTSRSLFPSASEMSRSVKAHMPSVPWRRKKKAQTAGTSTQSPHAPVERSNSGSSQQSPGALPRSQLPLGQIFRHFLQWRRDGQDEVARIQAGIDDMWLQEVMLGCDTELFETVRKDVGKLKVI